MGGFRMYVDEAHRDVAFGDGVMVGGSVEFPLAPAIGEKAVLVAVGAVEAFEVIVVPVPARNRCTTDFRLPTGIRQPALPLRYLRLPA